MGVGVEALRVKGSDPPQPWVKKLGSIAKANNCELSLVDVAHLHDLSHTDDPFWPAWFAYVDGLHFRHSPVCW